MHTIILKKFVCTCIRAKLFSASSFVTRELKSMVLKEEALMSLHLGCHNFIDLLGLGVILLHTHSISGKYLAQNNVWHMEWSLKQCCYRDDSKSQLLYWMTVDIIVSHPQQNCIWPGTQDFPETQHKNLFFGRQIIWQPGKEMFHLEAACPQKAQMKPIKIYTIVNLVMNMSILSGVPVKMFDMAMSNHGNPKNGHFQHCPKWKCKLIYCKIKM